MAISVTDFTNNVVTSPNFEVTGDGVFDDIMGSVTTHIQAQYDSGKISGTEYATVYLGAMQSAMQTALKLLLERDLVTSKTALIDRQAAGFNDDAKQKLLKQALDSWSVAYSVSQADNSIPDSIKVDSIDQIMKNAMDSLGVIPTTAVNNTSQVLDTNPLGIA